MHVIVRLGSRFGSFLCPRPSSLITRTAVTASANVRPYNEVPGPKPLPILGNSWRFLPGIGTLNMADFVEMVADLKDKYGNLVKLSHIPGRPDMLFVLDPMSVEHVLRKEGSRPERVQLESMAYFRSKVRNDFFEGNLGLVMENGDKWQEARTIVNQPMMQPKAARRYAPNIDQVAIDFTKRMSDLRNINKEMPADFDNELKKWALESISLVTLDTRLGCLESNLSPNSDPQRMINAFRTIFEASYELEFNLPFWKIMSTPTLKSYIQESNTFLEIALKHVERALKEMRDDIPEESQSVLQQILKRDPSTKRAVIMAMDMMGGGIDTTSTTASWALYHLARNPAQQAKLFKEVSALATGDSINLTADVIDSMKYLKACIKESIRLTPVGFATARILHEDVVLNNYTIPKGVMILLCNGLMYRMEEHFPQAKKFVPERWLRGEDPGCPTQHKTHPYVYLPFGHGPRQCVGFRFANLELETLLARVIQKFRLEWHHGDMRHVSKMLIKPADPLRIRVLDR